MPIRLANNCVNCTNYQNDHTCTQHHTKVTERHTCDSFNMQQALKMNMTCGTCSRFNTPSCAHPAKAAPEMSCSSWAPQAMA
ncbi:MULTISPECIES: hypothetical protein [Flavobacteriaceae]|uniref:hypothetical protein n=1 Tax=Flavobacteriaceae TaxID=49546 RepID=UPI0010AE2A8D|nr:MULTISPECIES: hypothetical protein [Flavobacteriaceae]NJB37500.1 hypothetical protein [Croceivirga sp. JEA036]TKD61338.1 hypothetical protein FBT53_11170 [Flavobacterium sp. ASW18X]